MPSLYSSNTSNVVTQQTMGLYTGNITPYPTSAQALFTLFANTGNVVFDLATNNTKITANVTFPFYANSNVANYLPIYTGNISAGNLSVANTISGNIMILTGNANVGNIGATNGVFSSNVSIVGSITSVDSVQFDTTATTPNAVARLVWDDPDGTLGLGLKGGNVVLQIGQEEVVYARNNEGTAITNGQIVYVEGSQGQRVSVKLANAANEMTSTDTLGMLTENISNNGTGFVTVSGLVNGLNTNTDSEGNPTTEGDLLYLSANIAGGWTNVKPTPPAHSVRIGYLVKKSAGNGSIFVKVDNGYELDELHDVLITSPTQGQALVYGTGNLWRNQLVNTLGTLTSLSVSGNANIGNIGTAGLITAEGVVRGGALSTGGSLGVTGNANIGNIGTAGLITATGNIQGGNLRTTGILSVGGNANIGNIGTAGIITATGNITGGNLSGTLVTGTLTTAAQPNITSVGTLTSLSVSGNANAANLNATNAFITGNGIVGGNLFVNGTLTYLNVDTLAVEDPIIELGTGPNGASPVANSGKDIGTSLNYFDTSAKKAFMGWDVSNAEIAFGSNVSITNEIVTFTELANTRSGNTLTTGVFSTTLSATGNANVGNIGATNGVFTNVSGNGALLTNLNASNLSSGTVLSGRISGNYTGLTGVGSLVVGSIGSGFGNINIGSNVFTGNGSGLTAINASNITTGTIEDARLSSNVALLPTSQTFTGQKIFNFPILMGNANLFNINGNTPASQQNGLYVADLGATIGNTNNPTFTAAIAGQINTGRSIALSVDADGYLWGYRNHTNSGNYTWQSRVYNSVTAQVVSNAAQPNITSVGTLSSVSVSGNATIGNISTSGIISATGNITGGNISTSGNATAAFFIGDGSQLSNLTITAGTSLINGNSNVVVGANSDVSIAVAGANRLIVSTNGISVTGNANIGNIGTAGLITATGNINTSARMSAVGLSTSWGVTTGNSVGAFNGIMGTSTSATWLLSGTSNGVFRAGIQVLDTGSGELRIYEGANVIRFAGNQLIAPALSVTGNIVGTGILTVTGNANIGNIGTAGLITATGNVFVGGRLSLGGASLTSVTVNSSSPISGGVNAIGLQIGGSIQSDATGSPAGITSAPFVAASAFTINNLRLYNAFLNTIGTGANITTISGYSVDPSVGASANVTTAHAYRGLIAAGTNRWNLFMDGTANNYLAGNLGIGNTSPNHTLSVTGIMNVSGNANVGNLGTAGLITATGNITGGNLNAGTGIISTTGNVNSGNLNLTGNIVDSGPITIQTAANGNIAFTPNGSGITLINSASTFDGNITINGRPRRIFGDFSNVTINNRVAFQTSAANKATSVGAIPSYTLTGAEQTNFAVFTTSDPDNSAYAVLGISNDTITIGGGKTGSGATSKPLIFVTDDAERARITAGGIALFSTTNDSITAGSGLKITNTGQWVAAVSAETTSVLNNWSMYSTGAGAYRFYVGWNGTIFATTTTISAISDERLKENIRDLDLGLDAIMAVKPRRFDWKEGKGQDKKNAVGFIAQEYEKVFTGSVSTSLPGEDGIEYKTLNHEELIPTLVKAIQEQQAIITDLRNRIEILEGIGNTTIPTASEGTE